MTVGVVGVMQLSFTEKGVRKAMEHWPSYQGCLGDDEVLDVFKVSKGGHLNCAAMPQLGDLPAATGIQ